MKHRGWKIRRIWYLLSYVGIIILAMGVAGVLMERCDGWVRMAGHVLLSLDIMLMAWMTVVVFDSVLKKREVLGVIFVALISMGICVYSAKLEYDVDEVHKITDVGRVVRYMYPIDNTLSLFFLSGGEYYLEYSKSAWYYVFHFMMFLFLSGVLMSLFGKKMLSKTLCWAIGRDKKCVFWGYSMSGKVLAKDMMRQEEYCQPVFALSRRAEYDNDKDPRIFDELIDFGAIVLYEDLGDELRVDGKRHFFMSEDQDENVCGALKMIELLKARLPKLKGKTYLHVRTEIEGVDALFQEQFRDNPELKKRVEVNIYSQSDLAARSFVRHHPVLDLAGREFKPEGKRLVIDAESATVRGECNVLLLGLGWSGYELLRKTVCDAQFPGNEFNFKVTVIDNDYITKRGRYLRIFETAKRSGIEIEVNPSVNIDGKGEKNIHSVNGYDFYRWLATDDKILEFDRIIVSLGNDELNTNTAMQLHRFRLSRLKAYHAESEKRMPESIFVQVKDYQSYRFYKMEGSPIVPFGDFEEINSVDVLVKEKMDVIAKMVNHVYCSYQFKQLSAEQLRDKSAVEESWDANDTNIFNQNSSRSVALTVENTVRIGGGIDSFRERVKDPYYLERYSEMEHKRWNAFHIMCGVDRWERSDVSNKKGKLLFGGALAKHICIAEYDELDEITEQVRSLGNVNEDYKESDRRIVRHFPLFYEIMNGR